MAPWPIIVVAGLGIGVLLGLFGVGGSSVATPVLSLLGVPGLLAVASPLPATIPAALLAARPYVRAGEARPKAAGWSLLGGIPATIVGAYLSRVVGAGPCSWDQASCSSSSAFESSVQSTRPLAPRERHVGRIVRSSSLRRGRRALHRTARERRRVSVGAALPARLRPPDARRSRHQSDRHRRPVDSDVGDALGARPYRLDRRLRVRRRPAPRQRRRAAISRTASPDPRCAAPSAGSSSASARSSRSTDSCTTNGRRKPVR